MDRLGDSLVNIIREEERDGRATQPANERQYGGDHYKRSRELQHWDMVHVLGLNYFAGNATKYVSRYRRKGGLEDLAKAIHYCDKAAELGYEDRPQFGELSDAEVQNVLFRFAAENDLDNDQYRIIFDIVYGAYGSAGSVLNAICDALSKTDVGAKRYPER